MVDSLRTEGYGVTYAEGQGANGPVTLIYTIVMRKELPRVVSLIQECHPNAFFTVEELRSSAQGIFPMRSSSLWDRFVDRTSE